MNYYKAIIQYDGTNYAGFQWQKDIVTVQGDFNQALKKLLSGKITTMGASRTDTGVHAIEQIVKITSEQPIESETFLAKLNDTLPTEIRCLRLNQCEGSYKPASDSSSKEYRYLFTNKLKSSGEDQKYIANNPYPLDIELMKQCCLEIVGRNDFKNFCSAGSNVKTTIRDVNICELTLVNPHDVLPQSSLFPLPMHIKECYQLRIVGPGFLKQMVRHLMSAMWMVGNEKISAVEFSQLLNGPMKTKRMWKVADARGLYLYSIK